MNVEAQESTKASLLNWTRRLIAIRKKYPVFGRGSLEFLLPENRSIVAFLRKTESQTVLCVNNLSQYPQPVALDLRTYRGSIPIELLGNKPFPAVADAPYFLSLGGHDFFWFLLEGGPEIGV